MSNRRMFTVAATIKVQVKARTEAGAKKRAREAFAAELEAYGPTKLRARDLRIDSVRGRTRVGRVEEV